MRKLAPAVIAAFVVSAPPAEAAVEKVVVRQGPLTVAPYEVRYTSARTREVRSPRLDGYLVLQAHRLFPGRGVNIVDWEADDPDVRRALLRATMEWGGFRQVSTWSMSLSGETRGLLEAAGFVPAVRERLVRQGPVLLVRALGGAADRRALMLGTRPARDPGSWDFRMLYSMAG